MAGGTHIIENVHTVRERELAFALLHAVQYLAEFDGETRWYKNVLSDSLLPGEKVLADETVEAEEVSAELVLDDAEIRRAATTDRMAREA